VDSRNVDRYRKLSLIIDDVLNTAILQGFYQVAIENLEFKDNYKYKSKKLNRLLSKFSHTKFDELITSKCKRKGLILKKINPAYISIIGIFKYFNRDNLNISHNANSKDLSAALVIGRKRLGFQEKTIVSVRGLKRPRGTTEIVSMPIKSLLV
jgi:IS605 OrfB family transposase